MVYAASWRNNDCHQRSTKRVVIWWSGGMPVSGRFYTVLVVTSDIWEVISPEMLRTSCSHAV